MATRTPSHLLCICTITLLSWSAKSRGLVLVIRTRQFRFLSSAIRSGDTQGQKASLRRAFHSCLLSLHSAHSIVLLPSLHIPLTRWRVASPCWGSPIKAQSSPMSQKEALARVSSPLLFLSVHFWFAVSLLFFPNYLSNLVILYVLSFFFTIFSFLTYFLYISPFSLFLSNSQSPVCWPLTRCQSFLQALHTQWWINDRRINWAYYRREGKRAEIAGKIS